MRVFDRTIPLEAATVAPSRPIVAIVLHHTATTVLPFPRRGGSWHYCVDTDGTVWRDVSEPHAAHHTGQCDRWRPPWVVPTPPHLQPLSDINYCTIGIEIVYAPQAPWQQEPTAEQYTALRELLADISSRYDGLPVVGHGELDLSRWPSEPHDLQWAAVGLGPRESDGRHLLAAAPPPPDAADETAVLRAALDEANHIKAEFEAVLRALEGQVYVRERRTSRAGRTYTRYVPTLPPGTVDALIAAGRGS